jgi:hypothetical protein
MKIEKGRIDVEKKVIWIGEARKGERRDGQQRNDMLLVIG